MKWTAGRASLLVVVATLLLYAFFSITQRYVGGDGHAWRAAISSDGDGYYAYLTGLFVDGGLAHANAADFHFAPAGEGRVIKYFCGTALVQAPFFLLAHAWCTLTGTEADGRTLPYQIAIGVCSLCLLLFGLMQLRALLRSFQLNDATVAATLSVLVLGTGLLYQAVITPSMSHTSSFAMIVWSLREARSAWAGTHSWALVRAAIAIALTILIRPVNILAMLALPVVCIDLHRHLGTWIKLQGAQRWVIASLVFIGLLSLQPLAWYVQCGRLLVMPYAGEGFYWDRPMLFQLLFSARKGLFFYWPLLLLAFPGLVLVARRSHLAACSIAIAVGSVVYVASCWWTWYYGHSYGMRPLIDHLALFAIPIAFLYDAARHRWKTFLCTLSVAFIALQCFQVWQYQTGILSPFNMDREKYRMILLRSGEDHRYLFGDGCASPPYAPNGFDVLVDASPQPSIEQADRTWRVDGTSRLGPGVLVAPPQLPDGRILYVEADLLRKAIDAGASNTAEVICTIGQGGNSWYYNNYRLNDIRLPDDRYWRHWRYAFYVPAAHPGDEMRVYVVQNGAGRLLVRDAHVRISAVR